MTEQEIQFVKELKSKYEERETTTQKIEKLRDLDASVYTSGTITGLILGILGILIFGTGMCCCLLWNMYFLGVVLGIVGIQIMALAYPTRNRLVGKKRKEVAKDIQALSNELLGENC
ncbi:MAG: hypothetical protein IJ937_13715 [Treponema sp.]|nr:hypothetical protein [Treponema sp.]